MNFQNGEIWLVQFSDPPEGGEQGYRRPAVIVSNNGLNDLPLDVVIVVPATTTGRQNPRTGKVPANLVAVNPSKLNGLAEPSFFMTEQVRAVSKRIRMKRKLGLLASQDIDRIKEALRLVMDL